MTWPGWHWDILIGAGFAAAVCGIYAIYAPAALIAGGAVLVAMGLRGATR